MVHIGTRGSQSRRSSFMPRLPSPFHLPFAKDFIADLHPFSVTMIPPFAPSRPTDPFFRPVAASNDSATFPSSSLRLTYWRKKCKVADLEVIYRLPYPSLVLL